MLYSQNDFLENFVSVADDLAIGVFTSFLLVR